MTIHRTTIKRSAVQKFGAPPGTAAAREGGCICPDSKNDPSAVKPLSTFSFSLDPKCPYHADAVKHLLERLSPSMAKA